MACTRRDPGGGQEAKTRCQRRSSLQLLKRPALRRPLSTGVSPHRLASLSTTPTQPSPAQPTVELSLALICLERLF